ncbi:MAG: lipoyl(octanoyl) transferase LipB [Arenicella sp.]
MIVKHLGVVAYEKTLEAMQTFVAESSFDTADEIWMVEHPPVYTQGTACDLQALAPTKIPVVKSDRGGQITYHGPGQVVMYVLLNIKRNGLGVKGLVEVLEQTMIDVLASYEINAERLTGAPGVYVDGAKIGALGLRVRKGFSYHGLSLNVDMDLSPFHNIDPCGYQGMQVTQMSDLLTLRKIKERVDIGQVSERLISILLQLVSNKGLH